MRPKPFSIIRKRTTSYTTCEWRNNTDFQLSSCCCYKPRACEEQGSPVNRRKGHGDEVQQNHSQNRSDSPALTAPHTTPQACDLVVLLQHLLHGKKRLKVRETQDPRKLVLLEEKSKGSSGARMVKDLRRRNWGCTTPGLSILAPPSSATETAPLTEMKRSWTRKHSWNAQEQKTISTESNSCFENSLHQDHETEDNRNTPFQTELNMLTQSIWGVKTLRIRNTKINNRSRQRTKKEKYCLRVGWNQQSQ